ncbi:mitochondrial import receptor subunit TOM40 homolog [Lampris incognitus]|uniref:mitochondrial import receptor subunit TOM40 homolog n=1 Tax=Lampris incognitus TaxID=2546036 RepID=UPI0024B626FD|nr:mitochondrial import receptor subunit TOM40 homolog [Lampris incognitus]
MGSVLALSSGPGHQNWPFSTDPPPSRWDTHPAHWDIPPRWERKDGRLPNPGSFHSLHRSCKEVFPQQVEGVKMIINKTLSSFFKTQQDQFVTWQFETEYRGNDFTAAVTVANPDILRESVILVAHFLQSVSSGLVLGGELVYHRGRAEEGGILTLAGQYSRPNWVATLNAGKGGAHASYYHRANKQIQVGVEFEASTRTQETTASFGYQMELPEANMVFRGMVNSRCIIGGVLEKRLTPLPATLIMGAFVNHRGDKLQVGLGVNVG